MTICSPPIKKVRQISRLTPTSIRQEQKRNLFIKVTIRPFVQLAGMELSSPQTGVKPLPAPKLSPLSGVLWIQRE